MRVDPVVTDLFTRIFGEPALAHPTFMQRNIFPQAGRGLSGLHRAAKAELSLATRVANRRGNIRNAMVDKGRKWRTGERRPVPPKRTATDANFPARAEHRNPPTVAERAGPWQSYP